MQALADTGKPLSQAQKSMLIAGLLISLDGWVASWPKEDWTPYKWKYLSAQGEAKLTALVKLQAEKLAVLGEQVEEKLAAGLETLLLQCAQHTQVKNGELVVDEVGLMAHLTGQLGLYGPLADQVAAAWFTTVNQQQPIIMASSLFQSGFDEQASESAAGQALLAAFVAGELAGEALALGNDHGELLARRLVAKRAGKSLPAEPASGLEAPRGADGLTVRERLEAALVEAIGSGSKLRVSEAKRDLRRHDANVARARQARETERELSAPLVKA
jgi:hypothetical protein